MSTMTLILDRIEADSGVFEGLGAIPLALLPAQIREGAVLKVTRTASQVVLELDRDAQARREQGARSLQRQAAQALDGVASPVPHPEPEVFEL